MRIRSKFAVQIPLLPIYQVASIDERQKKLKSWAGDAVSKGLEIAWDRCVQLRSCLELGCQCEG